MVKRRSFGGEAVGHRCGRSKWTTIQCFSAFIATAITYGILLLAFHVMADATDVETETPPFVQRVQEGPFGLSHVDLILFGSFILLAFELLQFLVAGSGRTSKRVK